jgi:hypothetical protein
MKGPKRVRSGKDTNLAELLASETLEDSRSAFMEQS